MGFWTNNTDPKRKYSFEVIISSENGTLETYFAKSCTKPSFTITPTEHNYLNHTFHYPGRLTWNDINITFVDPGVATVADTVGPSDSASKSLVGILSAAGYKPPGSANDNATMSKSKAVNALQGVTINQLNDAGETLDSWNLVNAWISEINFGDLAYDSDELVEITCTIKYDFAKFKEPGSTAAWTFAPGNQEGES
jgi:hypothetical protein